MACPILNGNELYLFSILKLIILNYQKNLYILPHQEEYIFMFTEIWNYKSFCEITV